MSARWSGVPVLVTGAQGFVGSRLAERLLELGAEVVVPRRDVPARSYFRMAGLEERCTLARAGLFDFDALLRVLDEHEVRAVFHLAAQASVPTATRSPFSTLESNVRGTYELLEACRAAGVVGDPLERVVVASSDKAYGGGGDLPRREDSPLRPRFPYEVSKAAADMIARSYACTWQLAVAAIRLANVYGPGDLDFTRLVPGTARALVRGERPLLRSDGTPVRDFLHASDAVAACLAVAESLDRAELRGRAWNAGAGEPVAVIDVVRRLTAASGREVEPDVRGGGSPPAEIEREWLDTTAIREELGWTPERSLDDGLAETYRWYEEHLAD